MLELRFDIEEDTDMNPVEQAKQFAKRMHEGQFDKAGKPYYLHPYHVADCVKTDEEKIVAYLHDVVEDTEITCDDLRAMGFPECCVLAIDAISRRDEESYEDYLVRVLENPLATTVKIQDLHHNSDVTRFANPTERDYKRSEKYKKRIAFLEESRR